MLNSDSEAIVDPASTTSLPELSRQTWSLPNKPRSVHRIAMAIYRRSEPELPVSRFTHSALTASYQYLHVRTLKSRRLVENCSKSSSCRFTAR